MDPLILVLVIIGIIFAIVATITLIVSLIRREGSTKSEILKWVKKVFDAFWGMG